MPGTSNRHDQFSIPWWLVMVEGIVVFILGVLLVASPEWTITILVGLLGIYLLLIGVLRIVQVFHRGKGWGWKLVTGILGIIVGLFIIANRFLLAPVAPLILAYALAIVVLVDGIIHVAPLFKRPAESSSLEGSSPIMGIFELLFGVLLLFIPHLTASVIYITVAIVAIIGGIVLFFYAFSLRRRKEIPPVESEYEGS